MVVHGAPFPLERVEIRQVHDEHRDAGGDDRRDRQRLPFIAHTSRINLRSNVQTWRASSPSNLLRGNLGDVSLDPGHDAIRQANDPVRHGGEDGIVGDERRRGAELPIHPFQRFEDHLPGLTSSAPVGSSQSKTSGRLAMARAMATRCCSPPESCAGK